MYYTGWLTFQAQMLLLVAESARIAMLPPRSHRLKRVRQANVYTIRQEMASCRERIRRRRIKQPRENQHFWPGLDVLLGSVGFFNTLVRI
jgi:hypothetical protein